RCREGGPEFAKVLTVLAPRLQPQDAVAAFRQLHEGMRAANNYSDGDAAVKALAEAVTLLVRRVNPDEAATAALQVLRTTGSRPPSWKPGPAPRSSARPRTGPCRS